MATNHYFQSGNGIGTRSEQDLLQRLTTEVVQIAGVDFVFLPRTIVKEDHLFQEDYLSQFTKNYTIEMYIENYEEFLGNRELFGKFGFQQEDQLKLIVSRERFTAIMGKQLPVEGDLIWFPLANYIFEIKFVDDKKPLFPLGTKTYFILTCEAFKYSREEFSTGTDADDIMEVYPNNGATGMNVFPTDKYSKNANIKELADVILDFNEKNPFSGQ